LTPASAPGDGRRTRESAAAEVDPAGEGAAGAGVAGEVAAASASGKIAGSAGASGERRAGRLLAAFLAAVTLLRLALGWRFFGFLSGDDVEILEAGWRTLGLHYTPWEIRNTLLSDLLVRPVLLAAHAFGAERPRLLVWLAAWPFVALATLNVYLLFRLVRAWSAAEPAGPPATDGAPRVAAASTVAGAPTMAGTPGNPGGESATNLAPAPTAWLALAAACLYALHWIPLGFATMTYPRTLSATCVLAAALLVARTPRRPWCEAAAGAVLALAFACRYSEAVYLPAVAVAALWPLAGRRARRAALLRLGAGFAGGVLLTAGAYEALTWGRPFAALLAFARFTLIERQSSSLTAAQPVYWYLWRLPHWWSPAAWPLAWLALRRPGPAREPAGDQEGPSRLLKNAVGHVPLPPRAVATAFVVLPVALLSAIHHKEVRYLQGVIPFACAVTAAGAWEMRRVRRPRAAALLLAAALLWQLVPIGFLRKKSMPAVLAAEALASDPAVRTFAGAQLWAYGDRIYLGNRRALRDIPYPASPAGIERLGAGADAVALYAEDLARRKELTAALMRLGLCSWRDFAFPPAKTVSVWRPCPPHPS
jgi:hypothetical protein